jgi:hypothetical protein
MVELWYPTNASCVSTNAAGISYEEFSCIQPAWMRATYLPYVIARVDRGVERCLFVYGIVDSFESLVL